MSPRAIIGVSLAVVAGLVVFLFVSMSGGGSMAPKLGAPSAVACPNEASEECLPKLAFKDTNHVEYAPESFAGKVTVINFWATWCGPCKKEIPAFSRVYDKYQGKVAMLGLLLDSTNPDDQTLLNFMSDFEMTYPIVRATGEMKIRFGSPNALPTTMVFDKKGHRRILRKGPMEDSELSAVIDQLLAE